MQRTFCRRLTCIARHLATIVATLGNIICTLHKIDAYFRHLWIISQSEDNNFTISTYRHLKVMKISHLLVILWQSLKKSLNTHSYGELYQDKSPGKRYRLTYLYHSHFTYNGYLSTCVQNFSNMSMKECKLCIKKCCF